MSCNKRQKIYGSFSILHKRKRCSEDYIPSIKHHKLIHCIIHEHSYICAIYDCSGIKIFQKNPNIFMSYIT